MTVLGIINHQKDISKKYSKRSQFDPSIDISFYTTSLHYHNDVIDHLSKNKSLINDKKNTAGISMVLTLVDLGLDVTIYGFTCTDDHQYRTYYWPEVIRDKRNNKTHNSLQEYHILKFIIENKYVKFEN